MVQHYISGIKDNVMFTVRSLQQQQYWNMCVYTVGVCAGKAALCDDGQMCGCGEVMLTADYPDGILAIGVCD